MSVKFQYGTQADYDSLENFDSNCIYFITDTQRVYRGDTLYASGIKDVIVNGESVKVEGIVDISVPTKTSELQNDSGYITADDVPPEVYVGSEEPQGNEVIWVDNSTNPENINATKAYVDNLVNSALADVDTTIAEIDSLIGEVNSNE